LIKINFTKSIILNRRTKQTLGHLSVKIDRLFSSFFPNHESSPFSIDPQKGKNQSGRENLKLKISATSTP
jgi:hypothetical protein